MTRLPLSNVCGSVSKWALGLALLAAAALGCVDVRGDYDEFVRRPVIVREAGTVDVEQSPCLDILAQNVDGRYFGSCLVKSVGVPFSLSVTQAVRPAADGGAGGEIDISFTALKTTATTLDDTAGDPTVLMTVPLDADCRYREDVGTLILPAEANSLNRDLEATNVVLRGKLLGAERSCSELDGRVPLVNLSLDEDGDACIYLRATEGMALPTIPTEEYVCDPSILLPR
jgi:hypothetical protein